MANSTKSEDLGSAAIVARLEAIESRLLKVETDISALKPSEPWPQPSEIYKESADPAEDEDKQLEFRIGEYGLGWLGGLVLVIGLAFLIAYIDGNGYPLAAAALGLGSSTLLFVLARVWQTTLPDLSSKLHAVAHLLIFFTVMRLHFFSEQPLVQNKGLVAAGMLIAVFLQIGIAVRQRSQALAGLAVILGVFTALLADHQAATMLIISVLAFAALYVFMRHDWWAVLAVTAFFSYVAHLLWLFNNPIVGKPFEAVGADSHQFYFLLGYTAVFALPTFIVTRTDRAATAARLTGISSAILMLMLTGLIALIYYKDNSEAVFFPAALLCLAISIRQRQTLQQLLMPAVYACCGYMALTIAVIGYTTVPATYVWLALQALLVVSMALWYRSKILVVVNSFIFIGIFATYLATAPPNGPVTLILAITALVSARVMNWQKDRLTLQTELLRNVYLGIAFFAILYGLFHAVPTQFVTLSWTVAGGCYLLLSALLNNRKYRILALATFAAAAIFLFTVDFVRLDAAFRVIAFLFLGLMLFGVSVYYAKHRKNKEKS